MGYPEVESDCVDPSLTSREIGQQKGYLKGAGGNELMHFLKGVPDQTKGHFEYGGYRTLLAPLLFDLLSQIFLIYYLRATYAGFGSLLVLWGCIQYLVGKGFHVDAHQHGRLLSY